jgi:hypothetical protein
MQDIVLLGASNLVLGWPAMMKALQRRTADPLRVNIATGMGRSYIKTSAFWFRRLPSILDCQLWNHLPQESGEPPRVLITDVGNDIVYLYEPDQIAESIRECIRKVRNWRSDAEFVMTGLPLASLMRVGKSRFLIARTILFPGCTLSRNTVIERSMELDRLVRQIAHESGIRFIEPAPQWYGMDPIHVLPRFRAEAFCTYFDAFELPSSSEPDNVRQQSKIRLPTAAQRTVFGREKTVLQPAASTPNLIVSAW